MVRRGKWRWLSPLAAVIAVAVGVGVWNYVAARSRPPLPTRTAAQVAAWAARPHPEPRSGSFELTTNLGLGGLGSTGGGEGGSLVALASGRSRARLWVDGPERSRIALLQPLAETDWVRNGDSTWVWHSADARATTVPSPSPPNDTAKGLLTSLVGGTTVEAPDVLAARLLAMRHQSTRLELRSPGYVAGRRAYELALIPASSSTLIAEVQIAVDAKTGIPLRVSVHSRGGTVAIDSRFTSIAFARPAPSNFRFQAPPGATVENGATASAPGNAGGAAADEREHHRRERVAADVQSVLGAARTLTFTTVGNGWNEVVVASGFDPWQLGNVARRGEPVSGSFGQGQLVRTPVFSVLIVDGGRVAAGAVTADRLESAVTDAGRGTQAP